LLWIALRSQWRRCALSTRRAGRPGRCGTRDDGAPGRHPKLL